MNDQNLILKKQALIDIADAIRAKTGSSDKIQVADLDDAIKNISGGNGGGIIEVDELPELMISNPSPVPSAVLAVDGETGDWYTVSDSEPCDKIYFNINLSIEETIAEIKKVTQDLDAIYGHEISVWDYYMYGGNETGDLFYVYIYNNHIRDDNDSSIGYSDQWCIDLIKYDINSGDCIYDMMVFDSSNGGWDPEFNGIVDASEATIMESFVEWNEDVNWGDDDGVNPYIKHGIINMNDSITNLVYKLKMTPNPELKEETIYKLPDETLWMFKNNRWTPIHIGGGIIKVDELPEPYLCLPVPNAGYIEKVYFDTNLSIEQVVAELEKLTYSEYGDYALLVNENVILLVIVINGTYIIVDDEGGMLYFASADPSGVGEVSVGWNPDFNGEIEVQGNAISEDGSVGMENDKIVNLFNLGKQPNPDFDAEAIYKLPDETLWMFINDAWIQLGALDYQLEELDVTENGEYVPVEGTYYSKVNVEVPEVLVGIVDVEELPGYKPIGNTTVTWTYNANDDMWYPSYDKLEGSKQICINQLSDNELKALCENLLVTAEAPYGEGSIDRYRVSAGQNIDPNNGELVCDDIYFYADFYHNGSYDGTTWQKPNSYYIDMSWGNNTTGEETYYEWNLTDGWYGESGHHENGSWVQDWHTNEAPNVIIQDEFQAIYATYAWTGEYERLYNEIPYNVANNNALIPFITQGGSGDVNPNVFYRTPDGNIWKYVDNAWVQWDATPKLEYDAVEQKPITKTFKRVRLNTSLSIDEVLNIIRPITYTRTSYGGDYDACYLVYYTMDDGGGRQNMLYLHNSGNSNEYYRIVLNYDVLFTSDAGWNPNILDFIDEQGYIREQYIDGTPTQEDYEGNFNGAYIWLENDKLVDLVCEPTTSAKAISLRGNYTGEQVNITANGSVSVLRMLDRQALPTEITVDVLGSVEEYTGEVEILNLED